MIDLAYENQGTNSFLVCKLDPQEVVDTMSMGMISNNKIFGVIPFSYSQNDSERVFKYNISSKINLKQYFSGQVKKRSLLNVFSSIAASIFNSEEYMVEPNKFMIDIEYIYVDVSTAEAALICLPIINEKEINIDMGKFFKDIVYSIQFDQSENCDYVARIISFLNSNTNFSLLDFKKIVDGLISENITHSQIASSVLVEKKPIIVKQAPLSTPRPTQIPKVSTPQVPQVVQLKKESKKDVKIKKEKKGFFCWGKGKKKEIPTPLPKQQPIYAVPGLKSVNSNEITESPNLEPSLKVNQNSQQNFGETTVLGVSNAGETTVLSELDIQKSNVPFIIRTIGGEKISLNKPVFRIGKEKSYVDYFIADNTAVSRSHADIIARDGEYFVLDNNSTNHTYVDNEMVQSNIEIKITNGSKLKFANEEFEFKLS
ncbi:DUF6382 domain-containing protein [Clostridium lacusfryxellense]|uniref:DUF6382 domain-containing protein n=1 Tax=Clostridium lacusfryxellense TaxID=205328 RepID=UPI001C0C8758|nr:DUF6382 domain-containing protein [Clostridium lacusfryxellense]MBU3112350.1 FHA domain-containing protein [Clostridium lacusfryxellense]